MNIIDEVNKSSLRDAGRKDFHVSAIKKSYRIRGIVARTHTNSAASIVVLVMIIMSAMGVIFRPKNRVDVNSLIARIFVYSAIKIKANKPLLYSTLNPETNSDSPSAKSNGVRLVSARLVMNHKALKGISIALTHVNWDMEIYVKSKDFSRTSALSSNNLILTS